MPAPSHRPDRVDTRPDSPDRPTGSDRPTLSSHYRDDPHDIFGTTDDEPDDPGDPDDYTPKARTLARDLGYDPHTRTGPLADHHHPAVHDPVRWPPGKGRYPHELRTAAFLAEDGADVRLGPENHALDGVTHVDSIVRYTPDDPGTLTELKALLTARNIPGAIKNHVAKAVTQLAPHVPAVGRLLDGHVVVDGRACGLDAGDVLQGCQRLVGQANTHGQSLPKQIRFILGDATSRFYDPSTSMDHTGTTRFDRPDEHTFRSTRTGDPGEVHERY